MDAWLAIASKRDIRAYTDTPIPPEVEWRILDAGRVSGSSRNTQKWEFVVVEQAQRELAQAVYAPQNADKVMAAIKKLSDKPIRWILNTHFHPDHTGGNEALSKAGSKTNGQPADVRRTVTQPMPGGEQAAGEREDSGGRDLIHEVRSLHESLLSRAVRNRFQPNTVVALRDPDAPDAALPALLRGRTMLDGRATAYVCQRHACKLPVNTPDALAAQLDE